MAYERVKPTKQQSSVSFFRYWKYENTTTRLQAQLKNLAYSGDKRIFYEKNYLSGYDIFVKAKGKVYPVTCHKHTQVARRYSSTLSLTSTLRGGGWLAPHSCRFIPGTDPVPLIVQEAGWPPVPNWTGANDLVPTGIQTSDHPAVASRHLAFVCRRFRPLPRRSASHSSKTSGGYATAN